MLWRRNISIGWNKRRHFIDFRLTEPRRLLTVRLSTVRSSPLRASKLYKMTTFIDEYMVNFAPKSVGGVHHDGKPQPMVASAEAIRAVETLPVAAVEAPRDSETSVAEAVDTRTEADREQEGRQMAAEVAIQAEEVRKKAAARFVVAQGGIAAARATLMHAAPAPRPEFMPEAPAYQPEPMPRVDPLITLDIPRFGDAQFLFVDPDSQMMYFATPAERARVGAASIGDHARGSRGLADFSPDTVVALTPGQVRDLLARQPSGNSRELAASAQTVNSKPWADRYAA